MNVWITNNKLYFYFTTKSFFNLANLIWKLDDRMFMSYRC